MTIQQQFNVFQHSGMCLGRCQLPKALMWSTKSSDPQMRIQSSINEMWYNHGQTRDPTHTPQDPQNLEQEEHTTLAFHMTMKCISEENKAKDLRNNISMNYNGTTFIFRQCILLQQYTDWRSWGWRLKWLSKRKSDLQTVCGFFFYCLDHTVKYRILSCNPSFFKKKRRKKVHQRPRKLSLCICSLPDFFRSISYFPRCMWV